MSERTSRQRAARRRGQATVEFALCVIVLLGVVLGLFDLGRAILAQWAISEMAWAGTRYASLNLTALNGGTDGGLAARGTSAGSGSSISSGSASSGDTLGSGSAADSAITAAARAAAFLIDTSAATVSIQYPDGDQLPGHRIRIQIAYAFEPISSQFIGGRVIQLNSANTLLILR